MFKRNRPRKVLVGDVRVLSVFFGGVLQVGDVTGDSAPFTYSEAYSGYRGAPSFVTEEVAKPTNTRLHYVNQIDEDVIDDNIIIGEKAGTFRPNIRGVKARL